jgi:hypothetical protein
VSELISKRVIDALFGRGGVLAFVVLVTGWLLAPTYFVDGDNAEFSTLSNTGGVAHPPGYPLYVLYLRLTSWIPGESAAHTAARSTAVLAALTVVALHAACRAWGARPWAASSAVAIYAGAPIVLRLHTAAEVFTLNVLVVSLVLLLSASEAPVRGALRIALLAFVAGLGLSNHHTCVLVAPVGLLGAARGVRESQLGRIKTMAIAIAALLAGLSPYIYTLVAPASPASWGEVHSVADLIALFTRRDYGGVGAFSPVPGEVQSATNLLALARTVGRGWLWLPLLAGLMLFATRIRWSASGEPRAGWIALAVSFCLAGPMLVARFNIVPEGIGLAICERFHLLPLALLVVPVAVALERAGGIVSTRAALPLLRRPVVQAMFSVLLFAAAAGLSLPHLLATHSPAVQRGVENLLRSLPPRAVVIGTADDLHFGAIYAQEIERIRPDVDVVAWSMTTLPWYRDQLAKRGLTIDPYANGAGQPSIRVAHQVFASGRPLFVEYSMGTILTELRTYPLGMLFRVLPPQATIPTLDEILEENRALLETFDLNYPRPSLDASYAVAMHIRYVRTWDVLARALRDANRMEDARVARDIRDWFGLAPIVVSPSLR